MIPSFVCHPCDQDQALVARFWKKPHRGKLVSWDTALHDRFMLPYFIEQDRRDICRDLRGEGHAFDDAWFAPFIEFRFPRYGGVRFKAWTPPSALHPCTGVHAPLTLDLRWRQR